MITGGTGGIGRAAAIGLASMGVRVGITGRDRDWAERAAAAVARESGNPTVDVFVADMSSQTEVRRLAGEVLCAYPRLDVLLNNVGGFWAHRRVTADGLEHTFALNHLAPFLLTSLLLSPRTRGAYPGMKRMKLKREERFLGWIAAGYSGASWTTSGTSSRRRARSLDR